MLPLFAECREDATVEPASEMPGELVLEIAIETPTAVPFELPTWVMAAMDMPAVAAGCSADVEQLV